MYKSSNNIKCWMGHLIKLLGLQHQESDSSQVMLCLEHWVLIAPWHMLDNQLHKLKIMANEPGGVFLTLLEAATETVSKGFT